MKQYKAKGNVKFIMYSDKDDSTCGYVLNYISNNDLITNATQYNKSPSFIEAYTKDVIDLHTYPIFDLMPGLDFLEAVLSGSITDYDGIIANIFVDGFNSNLGLYTQNLIDGEFLVCENTFREICNKYKVEVNWANK